MMSRIYILGTASAVPREGHENTHFLIEQGEHKILVDCSSNPILHLSRAGIELDGITDIVMTHFHPDHVSGLPLLLMDMWLLKRKKPLNIYGLAHATERLQAVMELFDWKHWPGFFPVFFHSIPEQVMTLAINAPDFKLYTSPVKHFIPTIGLRMEFPLLEKTVAYSCDTEPCSQVVELAKEVDLLIHEAAGHGTGHTSPEEAAAIARQANARELWLIHYDITQIDLDQAIQRATDIFPGKVTLATDFKSLEFA
jgi:ribonuclease Z